MSQRFPRARRLTTVALLSSGLILAGCGQTGPLYMPKRPAPLTTTPADASSLPTSSDSPTPASTSSTP